MAIKHYRATTPQRRHLTTVDYSVLTSKNPFKALTKRLKTHAGRNNQGRITTRHQGGGNKKLYREIDFLQNKYNVPAKIESIEYDPYRTAFIALILYKDGERRYILAPDGLKIGNEVIISENAPLKTGNRLRLKNVLSGYFVHNIELIQNGGGKLAKSAGSYAEVLGQEGKHTILKMPSKEIRKVGSGCWASIGQVSNPDWSLVVIGKAGRSRWLGIRPTVRGTAQNPCDHPYGGGEGRQPRGTKRPKTRWGKVTGGHRTRSHKKASNKLVMQRRRK